MDGPVGPRMERAATSVALANDLTRQGSSLSGSCSHLGWGRPPTYSIEPARCYYLLITPQSHKLFKLYYYQMKTTEG